MKEDSDHLGKKVKAIEVSPEKPISRLLEEMAETGFQGKNLAKAADVFCKMVEAEDLTIFFGYAGSLSTTGQWKNNKLANRKQIHRCLDPPPARTSPRI